MQRLGDSIFLSASDLVGRLNCRHLTSLDLAVANGELERPAIWDPLCRFFGSVARDMNKALSSTYDPKVYPSQSLTVSELMTNRLSAQGARWSLGTRS